MVQQANANTGSDGKWALLWSVCVCVHMRECMSVLTVNILFVLFMFITCFAGFCLIMQTGLYVFCSNRATTSTTQLVFSSQFLIRLGLAHSLSGFSSTCFTEEPLNILV